MTKILEEVNFVFKKCIFLSTLLMLTAFHLLISRHNLALYQTGPNIENFFFFPLVTELLTFLIAPLPTLNYN
jgi:hypothetical protein